MFSRGACNEESCKGSCLSEMLSRMISSGGCCLAEMLSRERHAGKMRRCLQGSGMRPPKCPFRVDKNNILC